MKATNRLNQQLDYAAAELIAGDSDDAPLSEDEVTEALRMSLNARLCDAYDR